MEKMLRCIQRSRRGWVEKVLRCSGRSRRGVWIQEGVGGESAEM